MRVLASADLHGNWKVYEWLLVVAREHEAEAVVLAGDLLGCPDGFDTPEDAQRHEARLLSTFLDGVGVPVLYIMGNDDLVELDSPSDRVRSIHGRQVECGGVAFVGYQYSLPFMGGTFEKPDADIRLDLAELRAPLGPETVFVSHSPVFGVLDPGFGDARIGSKALGEFLDANPFKAHIHGHSHAGFGRSGKRFNVASGGQERAMIIDLDSLQCRLLGAER